VKEKTGLLFFACVLLVALGVSVSPASAQNLCSGRCLVDDFGRPYCSLSAFGHVICVEEVDLCAEFACPYGALPSAKDLIAQCTSRPMPDLSQVEVVRLKARS
jgi:hypothetical protein